MMQPETTKKQDKVLTYFKKYEKKTGEPPTMRQAAFDLGYKFPGSVHALLRALEEKGLMRRMRGMWYAVEKDNATA